MDTSAEAFLKPLGPPPAPCEEYYKKVFYQKALMKGLEDMSGEQKPKDSTMRYIFIVIFIIIVLVIIGIIIAAFAVGVNNSNDSESTTINGQQVARGLFFRINRPPRGFLNPNVYTGP